MKKLAILFVIVAFLSFTFYGCKTEETMDADSVNLHNSENKQDSSFENFIIDTDGQQNDDIAQSTVEFPIITIESIDEYDKFIAQNANNGEILTYDNVKEYGTFKMFKILSDGNNKNYSQYCYSFDDGTTLYITDTNNRPPKESPVQMIDENVVNLNDMRILLSEESGMYYCGNLGYYYVSGKLLYIKWNEGNFEYRICSDSLLSEYPYGNKTKLDQLLNQAADK